MIRENASHHEDQHRNGSGGMGVGLTKSSGFGGLAQAAMKKNGIGGSSHAGIHLPSPQTIKQCLLYSDMGIKLQLILFDLSSTLWWSSVAEFFLFFYGFFVFCVDAKRIGVFWMFIPHLVRGALGVLIIRKMPTVSDMLKSIQML